MKNHFSSPFFLYGGKWRKMEEIVRGKVDFFYVNGYSKKCITK